MSLISKDMYNTFGKSGVFVFLRGFLIDSGFKAVVYYRIAHYLFKRNVPYLPKFIICHAIAKTGADIRPEASIGPGFVVKHSAGLVIGIRVKIGENCTVMQNVTLGEKYSQDGSRFYPTICNNVTICAGAVILGNVLVEDNVIVGANSVVTTNVPPNSIMGGIPARIIGTNLKI